jgi:RluA family pseudouridine synthase
MSAIFSPIRIIHEDAELLVVDKPAGLAVLPEGWDKEAPCLLHLLEGQHGKLWVVHRLDKVTSGVLVFARTAEAHRALNRAFELHQVNKVYHAIVVGAPGWEQHTARHPLRVNVGHAHRTAVDDGRGKPSQTSFRVLERFSDACLLEAVPHSGRTHQVRAHAAALGLPLLGDRLYGAPKTVLIDRPALHALALRFSHPASGKSLSFEAPYPEDFTRALDKLRGSS